MTGNLHSHENRKSQSSVIASTLTDWRVLGARIRQAAMVATSLHLSYEAGCSLDDGAVLETPRDYSGG